MAEFSNRKEASRENYTIERKKKGRKKNNKRKAILWRTQKSFGLCCHS
jgi:hypothetical protein